MTRRAEDLLSRRLADPITGTRAWEWALRTCADAEIEYLLEHETRKGARRLIQSEARRRGLATEVPP